jgi:hypothetical protein
MNTNERKYYGYFRTIIISAIFVLSLGIISLGISHAADKTKWSGVDEAVIEKVAKEHGRGAAEPLIDKEGDLLLFCFLIAGAIGGFAAGYSWRILLEGKKQRT